MYKDCKAQSAWVAATTLNMWVGVQITFLKNEPDSLEVAREVIGPFHLYNVVTGIDVPYEVIVFYFETKVRVFYSIFEDAPKST
jgi:hypothetical protein